VSNGAAGQSEEGVGTLRLRPELPEDVPFLHDLYASTRAEELDLTGWDGATRAQFVAMQFSAQRSHYRTHYPDAQFDVIELGGRAVGRLYVLRGHRDIVLMEVALLPQFRNMGIGSRLLRALVDEGAASHRALALHVETNNARAHAWYQRFGFSDVKTEPIHIEMRREPAIEALTAEPGDGA
jgi:ribosomal protein S18 acetylase RimI-like enzyme